MNLLSKDKLTDFNVLITAGPTREYIDDIRFITNIASGKLGILLAKKLYKLGANVKIIYGPGSISPPNYLEVVHVKNTENMLKAVVNELKNKEYDVVIFSAAVADYTPTKSVDGKITSGKYLTLKLRPTKKIIKEVNKLNIKLFKVGFKLESKKNTEELIDIAYKSLIKNKLNLVVANKLEDINGIKHKAFIITPKKEIIKANSKEEIADKIIEEINAFLHK